MVGLTLGMIGMLIVSKVLGISSGHQAVISAAGEAQSIGNLSLYTIERELKQAGFGISSPNLLGCQFNAYTTTLISRKLYPVEIQTSAGSDSLTIAYGSSDKRMGPIPLFTAYPGDDTDIAVSNRYGLIANDYFILGQPSKNCVFGQISSVPTTSTTAVSHISGTSFPYNKSGGLGVTYDASTGLVGQFYDLGAAFSYNTYSVSNNQLIQTPVLFPSGSTMVIADNVQAFLVRYGHDANADGTVDTWDTAIPTTSAGWAATTNVRMGLAIKNPRREATTITSSPLELWPSGPTVTLTTEEQHYRYRTYNVIVPLRNMIWRTF